MDTEYIVGMNIEGVATRSLENPNLPLNDASIWEGYGLASTSASGVSVTPSNALKYSPVWQAVNLISGDVAKLPLNVYQRLPNGGREKAVHHPAQKLVRRKANSRMAAFQFWRRMMVHCLIWNKAYALIARDEQGRPVELLPLLPDRTTLETRNNETGPIYVTEIDGEIRGFLPRDILHLEGISVAGDDCELVSKARDSWALGLTAENFASKFFKNGAKTSGILELPLGIGKKAAEQVKEGFYNTQSRMDNAFKTVILRDGAKFHSTSVTPRDGLMSDVRNQQVADVGRWYNLPPHKLGVGDNASYNSLEQENQSYLDSTLSHWLWTIKAESEIKLLTLAEQDNDTHYIEHNTRALLMADTKTQFEVGVLGVNNGLITQNEWRGPMNLNPVEGGDVMRKPLNIGVVGEGDSDMDNDERSERLAKSAEKVLQTRAKHEANKVLQLVRRTAKKRQLPGFVKWLQDDLLTGGCRDTFASSIREAAEPVAILNGADTDDLCERLADSFTASVRNEMLTIATEHTSTDIARMAISDACELLETNYTTNVATILENNHGTT